MAIFWQFVFHFIQQHISFKKRIYDHSGSFYIIVNYIIFSRGVLHRIQPCLDLLESIYWILICCFQMLISISLLIMTCFIIIKNIVWLSTHLYTIQYIIYSCMSLPCEAILPESVAQHWVPSWAEFTELTKSTELRRVTSFWNVIYPNLAKHGKLCGLNWLGTRWWAMLSAWPGLNMCGHCSYSVLCFKEWLTLWTDFIIIFQNTNCHNQCQSHYHYMFYNFFLVSNKIVSDAKPLGYI